MFLALISFWTHVLAAALFTALALWRLRDATLARVRLLLAAGFATTALWAWASAVAGGASALAPIAETLRNAVWLGLLHSLIRDAAADDGRMGSARLVVLSVAAVLGLQLIIDIALAAAPLDALRLATASTRHVLRVTAAAGALVIVHNIYGQAGSATRGRIRLPMLALGLLWAYDLNLYTAAVLSNGVPLELAAMRGAAAALTVPLFALAGRDAGDWRIGLSRAATFQTLSIGAICAYFLLMTIGAGAGEATGWDWLRGAQIVLLIAMTAIAAVLIPSGSARAWVRVTLAKHLFQHRYDYRAEWLRFSRLMGETGAEAAPLGVRAIKAVGDIVESPAGVLLVPDDGGRLRLGARWNWPDGWNEEAPDPAFTEALAERGRVIDFPGLRSGRATRGDQDAPVPAAMLLDSRIWAGVPLIHDGRLTGLVLLAEPAYRRGLDWEDFDLLRTAAQGAASYLAEARGQEALSEAARFDEFNRRFAFILHDVKNLVSGLSLVARNAERHADNPAFRADMVATLRASVDRMNDLLARLSPHEAGRAECLRPVALAPLLARLVAAKGRRHEVCWTGYDGEVVADPARLEQALGHLLDNAIDASPPRAPVTIEVACRGGDVAIAVIDRGTGMSADFVRTRLFQPFASTKPGGFGIGAHQARALITAIGGTLRVDSREGHGTRFTVALPAAERGEMAA